MTSRRAQTSSCTWAQNPLQIIFQSGWAGLSATFGGLSRSRHTLERFLSSKKSSTLITCTVSRLEALSHRLSNHQIVGRWGNICSKCQRKPIGERAVLNIRRNSQRSCQNHTPPIALKQLTQMQIVKMKTMQVKSLSSLQSANDDFLLLAIVIKKNYY